MKKLYLLIFMFVLSFVSFVGANNIDVENINSLSCNEWNVSIYLDDDVDSDNYHDKDIYLNSNFEYSETTPPSFQAVHIRNDLSKIQYTLPENNMLYSLKNGNIANFDNNLFNRAAFVFPYNTWVRWMDSYPNKVVFEQPINSVNNNNIVINYHYVYKLSDGRASSSNYNYWYNQPSNYLDHSNNITYCTLWSTPSPCSSIWSYRERSWFPNTTIKNTCTNFELFWCGDWELNSAWDSFDFGDSSELCDPNDTSHEWWGNLGCSDACEPINQWLEAPTCDLNVVQTTNWAYNVQWIITWTFDHPASLDITPTTVNVSHHDVISNNWTRINIVPTWYGTYTVVLNVENSAGSNFCTDSFYVQEEEHYCGDGNIDSPNSLWVYEECDDGNINNGDGCDANCELSVPSCNLTVNPTSQMLWSAVSFSANTNTWARYASFDLDDGTILYNSNIYFPYNYTYGNVWFYDVVLTVENDYNPILNDIVRPTNICGVSLDIIAPEPDLSIDKILLTTGRLMPWDTVEYVIELTNNGDGTYYGAYIIDDMPPSLELDSHDMSGISPLSYTSAAWQDVYGNRIVEYSGFDLAPGQTAYLHIAWIVRDDASANETLNCAYTQENFDCEIYSLAAVPYILKSQRMSNSLFSTPYTTGTINVNPGDYITYRIDFANLWGSNTTSWVLVRDRMPLCVDYVSASIHGVSSPGFIKYQDINWRWILEYNDFNLNQWQAWYMIITGQIMDGWICDTIDSYTNTSYIHFYNPIAVRQSSVTAIKSDRSIVNITKTSDMDINMPWDDKLFVVHVENFGPNPISNIILEDIRPAGTCIAYADWTGVGFTKAPASLTWTYPATLLPWDDIVLYISGSILDSQTCVNPNYENIVNLRYTELWNEYTDQANYHFAVSATPFANISLIKTASESSVSSGDELIYTIRYQNIGNATLNSYVITDYWPAMVDFVTASPFPSSIVNFATGSILQWNFYTPLLPGQTWEIILEWIVN